MQQTPRIRDCNEALISRPTTEQQRSNVLAERFHEFLGSPQFAKLRVFKNSIVGMVIDTLGPPVRSRLIHQHTLVQAVKPLSGHRKGDVNAHLFSVRAGTALTVVTFFPVC